MVQLKGSWVRSVHMPLLLPSVVACASWRVVALGPQIELVAAELAEAKERRREGESGEGRSEDDAKRRRMKEGEERMWIHWMMLHSSSIVQVKERESSDPSDRN